MHEYLSDEELVRRFVGGRDRDAFEALVRRHAPRIRRLLYGLAGGNREDIEDGEQEVVLALFRSLGGFRFRSSFTTFLYRVVRNRAIDLIRRRERDRRSLQRLHRGNPNVDPPHPEEMAVSAVARSEAMALLGALRIEERTVVLLREVEGLPVEEIARALRLPVGTVKSRLHRARARIEREIAAREAGLSSGVKNARL